MADAPGARPGQARTVGTVRTFMPGSVDCGRSRPSTDVDVVTEADLAPLPAPVQRYLRATGAIGQPAVRNFRARMHGRIREGPESRWMPFTAEQHNVYDAPARLFYMDASMLFVPVQVLHRYVGAKAAMRTKAAGLVPVVDMSGPEMTQAETVTLFNDMANRQFATMAFNWPPCRRRAADTS